jgi:hypothetical protein
MTAEAAEQLPMPTVLPTIQKSILFLSLNKFLQAMS